MLRDEFLKTQTATKFTLEEQAHIHDVDGMARYDTGINVCNHDGTDTIHCNICGVDFIVPCVAPLKEEWAYR